MARADKQLEGRRSDYVRSFGQIVYGATEALAAHPEASMGEIAEASGVARATLYRHFKSRDDLLREIYRSGLDSAADAIDRAEPEQGTAPEAIYRVVDHLMVVGDRYRIINEQGLEFPDLLPRAEAAFMPLIELFERGQREKTIRGDLSARWLTAALASLITTAIQAIGRGDLAPEQAPSIVAATFLEPAATVSDK